MRKIFSFLFILTFSCVSAQAQKTSPGKKHLNWGVKTGLNISTLQMDKATGDIIKWKTGFVAGAFFRIKAGDKFMIQPEFVYSSMGAKKTSSLEGDQTFRLNYFSIPLLANYKLSEKWRAVAGPQFDFLIIGKTFTGNESAETTGSYEDHSINVTGGFEYWPSTRVGFSARYIHGLTDISEDSGQMQNRGVQLTVALKL
jgi:hypothetical protein